MWYKVAVRASQHLNENVKLRLDSPTLRALERLAVQGDRTVAAEMRRALRDHVKAAEADGQKEAA